MIVPHDLDTLTLTFPTFSDERGLLSVAEGAGGVSFTPEGLPFIPQRVFWLYNIPTEKERGGHAHRSCWEALVALQGSVEVTLRSATAERTFLLNSPTKGILIPPAIWCDLKHFSSDCICLCMASEPYDATGYITEFKTE